MALQNTAIQTNNAQAAQRLGKNLGRYLGERIDIQSVLEEIQAASIRNGWQIHCFLREERFCLTAYHLPARLPGKRLYISAGIHGDEPAGPLAILELVRAHPWPS